MTDIYRQLRNDLNRRAKEAGAKGRLSYDDLYAVLEYYGNHCQMEGCTNTDVTFDHVEPLELGGENSRHNLGLLCESHNKGKGARSVPDYRKGVICPDDYVAANSNKTATRKPTPASWKPGQSGNPNGRPAAGMSWKELIIKEGDKYNEELGITRKEFLVMCAFDHAESGNAMILKELFQRSEPVADALDVTVNDSRLDQDQRHSRLAELLERARERRMGLVA